MKRAIFTLCALGFLLSACIKTPIDSTADKTKGSVVISPEWNLPTGEIAPQEWYLYTDYQTFYNYGLSGTQTISPAQSKELLIYNDPLGIDVYGGVASLEAAVRSSTIDYNPVPDNLYYGKSTLEINPNSIHNLSISTMRGTAKLYFTLDYDLSAQSEISSVKVELSGIASSRNLLTDKLSGEVTLSHYPIINPSNGQLKVFYNVLGVVGTKQELAIMITEKNGKSYSYISDITAELANLNSNMSDLHFENGLVVEGDIILGDWSIDEWESGDDIQ